ASWIGTLPVSSGLWSDTSSWWVRSPTEPSLAWSRDGAIRSNSANSAWPAAIRIQFAMRTSSARGRDLGDDPGRPRARQRAVQPGLPLGVQYDAVVVEGLHDHADRGQQGQVDVVELLVDGQDVHAQQGRRGDLAA